MRSKTEEVEISEQDSVYLATMHFVEGENIMKRVVCAMILTLLSMVVTASATTVTIFSDDFSYAANPINVMTGPQKWTGYNSSGDGAVYTESILWDGNTYSYMVVNEGNTVGSMTFALQNKNNSGTEVGADLDNGMISLGFKMTSRGEYAQRYWVNLTTNGLRNFDTNAQGISFSMDPANMKAYFGSESTPQATVSGFDSSYYTVRIDLSKDVCNFYFRPGQTVDPATLTDSDRKFSINTPAYQAAVNNLPNLRAGIGINYFANSGGQTQYIRSNFDDVIFTQVVPEPAMMIFLVLGGLTMIRRRK
jgi:hypothetical protein